MVKKIERQAREESEWRRRFRAVVTFYKKESQEAREGKTVARLSLDSDAFAHSAFGECKKTIYSVWCRDTKQKNVLQFYGIFCKLAFLIGCKTI